jgi:ketosteroid isomerase-like protein
MLSCNSNADFNHKSEILAVLYTQQKSWNNADIDGFMEGYWQSDSLMFVSKNKVNYGWQKVRDNYKKGYKNAAQMGTLTFDVIELQPLSPENYFMVGTWKIERDSNNIGGHFTLLWKNINGKWVVVADHTS